MTVRYKLFNDNKPISIYPDINNKEVITITPTKEINYFVDIVEFTTSTYWKVIVYCPNGDIVKGYVYILPFDIIQLHNHEELFDGRFNSDRIK